MSDDGVYDLGALELRLADANLSLRLLSEAKFATSGKDEDCDNADIRELIEKLSDGDDIRKPWVSKSHSYRLAIKLQLAPELEHENEHFMQEIGTKLKLSKCWASLGLVVTSVEIRSSDRRVTAWTISLGYGEQASLSERVRIHKLSPGLPFHDTKPPLGVHTIPLEAVHVSLLLTPAPNLSSCVPSHNAASVNLSTDENNVLEEDMLLTETYENDHIDDNHTLQRDGVSEEITMVAQSQRCNSTDAMHSDAMAQEKRACANRSLTTGCAYLTPPSSQDSAKEELEWVAHVHDPVVSHTHCLSADATLLAIETGLKHVMLGPPIRKAKSTAIVSNEDLKSLSSLAPALWVPGYHQSVSERAVFLPTISHAIANVSTHSFANTSLGEKVQQLVSRYPHDTTGTSPDNTSKGANHMQKATSAALWQSMASKLHETTPTKQIPIISDGAHDDNLEALEGPEDMLDGTATDADPSWPSEDSDFGDCLETNSELDNDDMCDWEELDDFASELCSSHSCWTEELEPRLPGRWNLRHPSNVDHDSDTFDNGLKFHEKDFRGGEGAGEGGTAGSRRESGRHWDGWFDAHDSMDQEFLDVDGDQGEVEPCCRLCEARLSEWNL